MTQARNAIHYLQTLLFQRKGYRPLCVGETGLLSVPTLSLTDGPFYSLMPVKKWFHLFSLGVQQPGPANPFQQKWMYLSHMYVNCQVISKKQ